jgi:hypothetical protein
LTYDDGQDDDALPADPARYHFYGPFFFGPFHAGSYVPSTDSDRHRVRIRS